MLVPVLMCLMGAMLIAKLFPETPTGRRLHQLLVEAPARWLTSRRARQMVWVALAIVVLASMLSHGIPLALPLDAAILETSTCLEILAALAASAALLRCRAAWSACRSLLVAAWRRSTLARSARPRARSVRAAPACRNAARSAPAEEGEPGRPWAYAFA